MKSERHSSSLTRRSMLTRGPMAPLSRRGCQKSSGVIFVGGASLPAEQHGL